MSASSSIVMDIIARDRASHDLNNVGDAADRAGRESRSMGDKMKTAAKVGLLALGAGAVVAGKFLIDATKAAIEDSAGQARLKKALENTTGANDKQVASVENWITKQGKALGVADDDLRPALSKLASATHDVGKAQKLASLAMDVSAGSGKSLESVSGALMKAQNGNVSALSRLGINTKDATGKTISMKEAVKRMGDTFGGAAKSNAETLGGKMGRLKLMFDETKETIGAKLIPVLTDLADWILKKAVPAVSQFIDGMKSGEGAGGKLAAILGVVGGVVKDVFGFVMANKDIFGILAGSILVVVGALKVWAAVQAVLNAVLMANPLTLLVVGIAAVIAIVVIAYKRFDGFRKVVDTTFSFMKTAISAVLGFVKDHWSTILVLLGGPIGLAVVLIVKNIGKVKGVFNTFMDVGKKVFSAVGKAGTWLWNNALQPALKFIVKGIGWVMSGWAAMLRALGKIPGFDWADRAAAKMQSAADKAYAIANGINKIPNKKNVTVTITAHTNATVAEQAILNGSRPKTVTPGAVPRTGGGAGGGAGSQRTVGGVENSGSEVHVHFHGPVLGTDKRALAQMLAEMLRTESRLAGRDILAA